MGREGHIHNCVPEFSSLSRNYYQQTTKWFDYEIVNSYQTFGGLNLCLATLIILLDDTIDTNRSLLAYAGIAVQTLC